VDRRISATLDLGIRVLSRNPFSELLKTDLKQLFTPYVTRVVQRLKITLRDAPVPTAWKFPVSLDEALSNYWTSGGGFSRTIRVDEIAIYALQRYGFDKTKQLIETKQIGTTLTALDYASRLNAEAHQEITAVSETPKSSYSVTVPVGNWRDPAAQQPTITINGKQPSK